MFNSKTTLEEFVLCIPTCYNDSKLENWFSAINQSPLKIVALIDRNGIPQGIMENHCLLEFFLQSLSSNQQYYKVKQKTQYESKAKFPKEPCSLHLCSQEADSAINLNLLQEKIVPLVSLSCFMKLEEFLANFAYQKKVAKNYFIVDQAGKLLGILNLAKLAQSLWFSKIALESKSLTEEEHFTQKKYLSTFAEENLEQEQKQTEQYSYYLDENKIDQNLSVWNMETQVKGHEAITKIKSQEEFRLTNPTLYSCLAQIAAPLIVENNQGEVCYQNDLWQKITHLKENSSQIENNYDQKNKLTELFDFPGHLVEKTITNRREKKQKTIGLNNYHCATLNNLTVVDTVSNQVKTQVKELNSWFTNQSLEEGLLKNTLALENNTEIPSKTNNQLNSWYYHRIPLQIKHDLVTISDSPTYWLIFTTQFPLQENCIADIGQQRQFFLKQLQDELLLNISHDIKSPLTAIIGLSSLLKEEKLGTLNSSQIRYSQMIYNSGKRLINLINDFLEITHLTTKKLEFNFESIELKSTFQQIYEQVTQKLKAATAAKQNDAPLFPEIQLDITNDAQIAIADKAYFSQILHRLLEIALNLTSAEGLLGITAEYWSNWLAITVWNEGGGFSEKQQNILTQEFSQYSNCLSSQEKNQALGLILAQQLAQAHGGDISFISQNNYGSEFTLLLPLQPSQEELASNAESIIANSTLNSDWQKNSNNNNSLVLIIETTSKRITDLSEKLKTLGYNCAIARNNIEALYKARCLKPWKILLNASLLETSANNLMQILKSDSQTFEIPLFLMRDTSSDNDWESLADEVLSYPVSRATLTQYFPPIVPRQSVLTQNLTVLRLSLKEETNQTKENLALDFVFDNPSFSLTHHIIEADSLEQAHLLAEIWNIDVIIWDGVTLKSPKAYLESFAHLNVLASIPIITLDAQTTAAANQFDNLTVFPCLLPANERSIQQLTQVIQIAAGFA